MATRPYWLNDEEWRRLEPMLTAGRRVISGIVHMLRSGARWRDGPTEYGPSATVDDRFSRVGRLRRRLRDFRRIATRNDEFARNFLSGAVIAAAVTYWRNGAS